MSSKGAGLNGAVGETVLGVELSFTWWVIFFELFVLLAAFAHLIGKQSLLQPLSVTSLAICHALEGV